MNEDARHDSQATSAADDGSRGEDGPPQIPALEWAAAAVGTLVLLAAFAMLAREGLKESEPVRFEAEVTAAETREGQTYVRLTVRNAGGKPAAEVTLTASAAGESRDLSVDFLPGGSERVVGLVLPAGVAAEQVAVTFNGWAEP